jgi:hypothetical protein
MGTLVIMMILHVELPVPSISGGFTDMGGSLMVYVSDLERGEV